MPHIQTSKYNLVDPSICCSHGPAGDLEKARETRGDGNGAVPLLTLSKNQWHPSAKHKKIGPLGLGPGALLVGTKVMDPPS